VWAIGVDSDQFNLVSEELQPYILTSMLKRVDNAVFEITKAQQDGTFEAGNTVYDLSVDGVGYSTSGDFLTEDQIAQIEDFKAQIVDGTIEVPTTPAG
jgi:basic membrane protein A